MLIVDKRNVVIHHLTLIILALQTDAEKCVPLLITEKHFYKFYFENPSGLFETLPAGEDMKNKLFQFLVSL